MCRKRRRSTRSKRILLFPLAVRRRSPRWRAVHQWVGPTRVWSGDPSCSLFPRKRARGGYGFSVGRLRNFRIVRAAVANKDENINKHQSREQPMVASADSVSFSIGALREDHSNVGVGNDQRFDEVITTRERLREIMGEPNHRVASKVIDHIDAVCKRFIAASPFAVIATKGGDGLIDQSPKGDPAGFVHVIDEKTL